jgi:hypothetical protein
MRILWKNSSGTDGTAYLGPEPVLVRPSRQRLSRDVGLLQPLPQHRFLLQLVKSRLNGIVELVLIQCVVRPLLLTNTNKYKYPTQESCSGPLVRLKLMSAYKTRLALGSYILKSFNGVQNTNRIQKNQQRKYNAHVAADLRNQQISSSVNMQQTKCSHNYKLTINKNTKE